VTIFTRPRDRRSSWVAAISIFAVLASGCVPADEEQVVVDLTSRVTLTGDDSDTALPVEVSGEVRAIGIEAGRTAEAFVRLPADAELRFSTRPELARGDFDIVVASDRGAIDAEPEAAERDSIWRMPLAGPEGLPVSIRLENRSTQRLLWVAPRVVGEGNGQAPVLEASLVPHSEPLNILVYVVDTLRADRMSIYGYERPTTPRLEARADGMIRFEHAYAQSSHTIPSVSSMFASRMPSELKGKLSSDGPARATLAEALRAGGYETAALQTNFVLLKTHGYARGFDEYSMLRHTGLPRLDQYYTAAQLHAEVKTWLRAAPAEPFFLYVQSMDVHFPYNAPAPFGERFLPEEAPPIDDARIRDLTPEQVAALPAFLDAWSPDRYDGGVAYADEYLERLLALLDELEIADRTVVVITSDHGEPLHQHGEFRHGLSLYEELVRIPLLLVVPGLGEGIVVQPIVSLLDLGPTLLDLAGVPVPESFVGRSLLGPRGAAMAAMAAGELPTVRDRQTRSWYLREDGWKLIVARDAVSLFDLTVDPDEENDVSSLHPVRVGTMMTELMARSPALRGEVAPHPSLSESPDAELQDALRALGYVD